MASDAGGDRPKSRRGGARKGAGRKRKGYVPPKVTGLDLAEAMTTPPPDEIDAAAQSDIGESVGELVKLLLYGESETAQIAAAKEILDRGYGKPAVEIGGDAAAPQLPFLMAPSALGGITSQVRTEARKYANLALAVMRKIRSNGASETARAAAAKALLDRAIGTVGKARMPDEQRDRPLGKKEEAARAAEAAATGKYATPAPPKAIQSALQ
jgi:hypothetical protein